VPSANCQHRRLEPSGCLAVIVIIRVRLNKVIVHSFIHYSLIEFFIFVTNMRIFSFVFLSICILLLIVSPLSTFGQYSCTCKCCNTSFFCSTSYFPVGSFSVSSCDSCSRNACSDQYRIQCPRVGGRGSSSASCTSVSGGSSIDWTGSWKADSQCDQNQCCCVIGDYTINKDNNGVYTANIPTINGSSVSCLNSATLNFDTAPGSSTLFTSSASGQSITYSLSSDGKAITAINNENNACSSTSTKNSAFSTYSKSSVMFVVIIGLISALVL
jgi:hypothetical protein